MQENNTKKSEKLSKEILYKFEIIRVDGINFFII